MIRLALIVLITAVTALHAAAAQPDAARAAAILKRAAAGAGTLTCSFEQKRTSAMLAGEATSGGTLSFSRPGLMRWEYRRPYSYIFVLNGDSILTTDGTRRNITDTRRDRLFARIVSLMSRTISGDIEGSRSDFDVTAAEAADGAFTITLTPRRRELRHVLSSVVLTADATTGLARSLTLHEKNGDTTEITFSDISLNTPIDTALFDID